MTTDLRVDTRANSLWLTIDRPERNNALTVELARGMTAAIEGLGDDIHAIVITATGAIFCPGADPKMSEQALAGGPEKVAEVIYGTLHGLVKAITRAPVPVIAALNGPALGGGLDLALACDLRIAHESAFLQSIWVTLGMVPGMGGAHAAERLLGSARAAELMLLGERVPAARALEWGLVNAVTPDVAGTAAALAARCAQLPRQGLMANKRALRRNRDAGLDAELDRLGREQAELTASPAFRAAIAAMRSQAGAGARGPGDDA